MEFRILGSLQVEHDRRLVEVSGERRCLLLAVLLLHPNQPLPAQRLIDWAWPEPSEVTRHAFHSGIHALRTLLAPAGSAVLRSFPGHRNETSYKLVVDGDHLDSLRFQRLAEITRVMPTGRPARGDADQVASTLREALALWRDDRVLAELPLPAPLRARADKLEALRLQALEARIDADLELDRHADLLSELDQLVEAHPQRERFYAQLMLARYRSGQQVAAAQTYQDAYRILTDRFGVEPGPDLQHLQQLVLARHPTLESPAQAARRAGRPYNLPPSPPRLVGREQTADAVQALLAVSASAVPVVAVHGRGGLGKTALAVHVAHRLRDRFPHGTLFVDLRGASPSPPEPAELLAQALHALDADGAPVPAGLEGRIRRFRTLTADRRVLLVLDNAANAAQVRPLLPGSPTCAVLVTSRTPLHALQATGRILLAPLTIEQAVELLGAAIDPANGAAQVHAEPEAARRVARLCGCLPLALRVAGGKLAARPSWSLEVLAKRLADRPLQELRLGDLDVRATLASSYNLLTAQQQRTVRLLTLADGGDLAPWAVAALLDCPVEAATDLLDELADAHLLEHAGGDRYRLHDLLGGYAAEQLAAEDPPQEREAALDRLLAACLHLVTAAVAGLPPSAAPHLRDTPRLDGRRPAGHARIDPLGVLAAERTILLGAVRRGHATGRWALTGQLAETLIRWCEATGRWDEWWQVASWALDAARHAGDRAGQAAALASLGWLLGAQGHQPKAVGLLSESLELAHATGDPRAEAVALMLRAEVALERGDPVAATDATRAAELLEPLQDRRGLAAALRIQGEALCYQGRLSAAEAALARSAELAEGVDPCGHAHILHGLAALRLAQDRPDEAATYLEDSLTRYELLDRFWTGWVLLTFGDCRLAQGRLEEAGEIYARCEELTRQGDYEFGRGCLLHRRGQLHHARDDLTAAEAALRESVKLLAWFHNGREHTWALRQLGLVLADQGRVSEAVFTLQQALRGFERHQARRWAARALAEIGAVHLARGDHAGALASLQQARAHLDGLSDPDEPAPLADLGRRLNARDEVGGGASA